MNSICPICKKEIASNSTQSPFPFCSWRCKKVDLYGWLNEEYCISAPIDPDAAAELASLSDNSDRETSF